MTTIFDTLNANGYEIVTCGSYDDQQVLNHLDGSSRKDGWKPPRVQRVRPTRRSGNKPAELPYGHTGFFMRRSAVDALKDVLDAHGEVLPLATDDDVELFVLNVRGVLDALDMDRSEIHRIEGTAAVSIRKHVFIESAIRSVEMFRIPLDPNIIYFTDRFVQRVKAAKLKGTDFIKLWSSE
jgi:hypothetical protein